MLDMNYLIQILSNLDWKVTFRNETSYRKFWETYKRCRENPVLTQFDFGDAEDTQERVITIKMHMNFIAEEAVRFLVIVAL